MKGSICLLLLLCAACAKSAPPPEAPPLVLDGFTSRETAGEDPVFDLTARRASVIREESRDADPASKTAGGMSALMRVEDVRFTLFSKGKTSGVVSAREGLFHTADKTVELLGGVTYHAVNDSLHVQAERMSWDPQSSVLRCETDVRGTYRTYRFSSTRLDLSRADNVMLLRQATFIGPG